MNDLDPKAQALLDSVRGADAPTRLEKTRVRRRVLARVAGVMLAASAGTSAKSTAASVGTVAARGWSAKLVVMAVAVSTLVAGGAATRVVVSHLRAHHGAVTAGPVSLSVAVSAPVATSSFLPSAPVQSVAPPTTHGVADLPATAEPTAALHRLTTRPAAAPRRQPATRSETLEEELPLLQNAQEALRLGDTDRALALLDDHAKRFPTGELSEERRAAHALAACRKTNGPAARAEAMAFVLDSPSSPLVESVRKACSLTEP